ncbi:MAG: glycosyltransferase [Syntrophales bacterium]|nr:glycosyltransferase [Syntrophales bacterium]
MKPDTRVGTSTAPGDGCNPAAPGPPARLVLLLQDLKFGGTQRQTLELARRLDPARFKVEVWVMTAGDDLMPLAREWHIPVVRLARQALVGPLALMNLWRRLQRQPPDLLMLLTVVPNIWGRILGRLARVPVIVGNCRGGGAPWRQHERLLWPLMDHLLCNTAALKTELTQRYGIPPAKITVILNGVDTEFYGPGPAGPRANPQVILSVARLVPDKDHDTLIAAFGQVSAAFPQAELWLLGDGPRRAAIEALAARTLPPGRVRFWPGQPDIRPFLHQACLLVLSSRYEALPNVVLEAMAAGLPVAATRVGGLPELVVPGRTGWLVPPGDAPALAAAMSQALGDADLREALGRTGREIAVADFSLEAMTRRYETVLSSLLKDRRAPKCPDRV